MNLSELTDIIHGIAVDTCRSYKEIEIDGLQARPDQIFKAPGRSDWAVAVEAVTGIDQECSLCRDSD
jgi:hypothetical protein